MRVSKSITNSEDNDRFGCIATLELGGKRGVRRFCGPGYMLALIDYCRDTGWRVVCISTPNTIYRDLLGHRERDADPIWQGVAHNRPDGVRSPERYKLAPFGGLDVLLSPDGQAEA